MSDCLRVCVPVHVISVFQVKCLKRSSVSPRPVFLVPPCNLLTQSWQNNPPKMRRRLILVPRKGWPGIISLLSPAMTERLRPAHRCLRWFRPAHRCLRWPRPAHRCLRWFRPAHRCLRWFRPAHRCLRWPRPAHRCLRWSCSAHLPPRCFCPVPLYPSAPQCLLLASAPVNQRFPSTPESWSRPACLRLRWPRPVHLHLRWPLLGIPRLASRLSPRILRGRLSPRILRGRLSPRILRGRPRLPIRLGRPRLPIRRGHPKLRALEATCPGYRSPEERPPPLPFRCHTARDAPRGKGG